MGATTELVRPFVTTRVIRAPGTVVWAAWTEADHLKRWFGPKDIPVTECSLEFRPGGRFHYGMRTPDGCVMWGKWIFREITAPDWFSTVCSFSDEAGGDAPHPLAPDWPLHLFSTVSFADAPGGTAVTVLWEPLNPTEAESRAFAAGHSSMQQGWGGTMDKLAAYLETPNTAERTMLINPYITINGGHCAEAMRFYEKVLGGSIAMMMTVGESPMAAQMPPEAQGAIMHARLNVGSMVLMASDSMCQPEPPVSGFSVSIVLQDPAEAERIFAAFAEGGNVRMPLAETFWAQRFGMVTDRFGTPWMINCEKAA